MQPLSDTVTVLRDGKLVTSLPTTSWIRPNGRTDGWPLCHLGSPAAPPSDAIGIEVANLSAKEAGIHDVSLSARRGEIIGLAGMLGSGRTELCETLFGLRQFDSGRLSARQCHPPASPREAMDEKIALVPEDRRNLGIFTGLPIWKNIALLRSTTVSRRTWRRPGEQGPERRADGGRSDSISPPRPSTRRYSCSAAATSRR